MVISPKCIYIYYLNSNTHKILFLNNNDLPLSIKPFTKLFLSLEHSDLD